MYAAPRLPVAILLGGAVALVLPGRIWADLAGTTLLVLGLLAFDVVAAPAPGALQVTREAPRSATVGQAATVALRLHNPRGRRLRVGAHDAAPPSLHRSPTRHALTLLPWAWADLPATLTPTRRGRLPLGPITLRVAGPLGLGGRQATLPSVQVLAVYPPLHGRREVELRLERARTLQAGRRSSAFRGGGTEFDTIRDYRPDDEFGHINWRATARSPRAMANVYREERDQRVVLLLDAGRSMAGSVRGVARFEHALDGAIAVAELAGRVGDHVGMVAFDSRVLAALDPKGGRAQSRRILEVLLDLHASLEPPGYAAALSAFLTRHGRRSLLVLLTDLAHPALLEPLASVAPTLLRRHLLIVGAVSDPELEELAQAMPDSSETAYLKAAASGALADRHRAAAVLGRLGVRVVDRPPGRLAGALADQYLRIKASGRL